MKRINQPFAWMVILAILAVFSRVVLVHHFWVPALIRFHLADFGFAAVLTVFFTALLTLLIPSRFRERHETGLRWTYLTIVLLATLQGLRVEYEDLVGEEQSEFDVGVLMSKWLGTPNSETFDWWDVVVICLGGILVFFLQWRATRQLRKWRRFPLLLKV